MKLKRYAEFKKLIITHRNPAQSCRVLHLARKIVNDNLPPFRSIVALHFLFGKRGKCVLTLINMKDLNK